MRATEIIRSILDLIDHIDIEQSPEPVDKDPIESEFKQIFDLLSCEKQQQMYDNSPDVHVSGVAAVTTDAGGGWNGPKHPADLRADSVSMYPNHQHRPGA
jgi:hypothetical protein